MGINISTKKTAVRVLGAGASNTTIATQPLTLLNKPLLAEHCAFEFLGLRFSRLGDLAPQIEHIIERLRHAALVVKEAPLPPASRRIIADGLGLSHLRFASGVVLPWLLLQKSLLGDVECAVSSLARAVCGTMPSAHREDVLREAGFASLDELACIGAARLIAAVLSVGSHPLRPYLGTMIRTSAFALVSSVEKIPWLYSHPPDPLRPSVRVNLLRPHTTDAWPIVWSTAPGGRGSRALSLLDFAAFWLSSSRIAASAQMRKLMPRPRLSSPTPLRRTHTRGTLTWLVTWPQNAHPTDHCWCLCE